MNKRLNLKKTIGNILKSLNDRGSVTTKSASKAVSAKTTTTIQSFTLSAGTWLIVSQMDLSASGSSVYAHVIPNCRTIRTACENGGGSIASSTISSNSNQTVNIQAYVPFACTVRSTVYAIRLK